MNYNLLLVDDEVHAVEGVKADLEQMELQIGELYVAYNAKQAKDVLEREHIDIMICDIEMPQESGLELARWVKEQQVHVVTIFLTSHADFRYAKEALRLGSLDYLLKPVLTDELEHVIYKAQAAIDTRTELHKINQSHQLWMKHHSLIFERFWLDLINQTIPSSRDAVREQIELHQLPLSDDTVLLPILIAVHRWHKDLNRRDEKIMEYALKNAAEELLLDEDASKMYLYLDRGMLLGIISTGNQFELEVGHLKQVYSRYIETCQRYFYCDISCYIGEPVEVFEIADMTMKLRQQHRDNVAFFNQVFLYHEAVESAMQVSLPDPNVWLTLLKTGTQETVISEIERFIEELIRNRSLDAVVLNRLHQDLLQAIYAYLNIEGIQAHELTADEQTSLIAEHANRSAADFLVWVHHVAGRILDQADAVNESASVVQTVQRYIAQHIDQDLSREAIAEMVYLNPDHLSRLFKKETGLSLSEYILSERIKLAKELLAQTDIPISRIASSVGHTNFSHFARIFRKYVGVGPSEYRNQLPRKRNHA